MTNEEAPYRESIEFFNLGQMAGKTLLNALHNTDYDVTKILRSEEVKTSKLYLPKHPCIKILAKLS